MAMDSWNLARSPGMADYVGLRVCASIERDNDEVRLDGRCA